MLTRTNATEIQAEAFKLIRLPSGNNGRTFRRFLSRVTDDEVVALAFADGSVVLDLKELKLHKKYAELHLTKLTQPGARYDDVVGAEVVVDVARSYVAVHFPMVGALDGMSQTVMRSMVFTVHELIASMKTFVENPEAEIFSVSPDGIKAAKRLQAQRERERGARFMQALSRAFPAKLAA